MLIDSLRLRRNTSAQWTAKNPILADAEPAKETDTGRFKLGDGATRWNDLPYFIDRQKIIELINTAFANFAPDSEGIEVAISTHVNAEEPHPAYDDGPSLVLLYENAKV
jgi:hypothetical protein